MAGSPLPHDLGPHLRLRGEVAGQERSFPLTDGEHLVGSVREAKIRLEVERVSRRHATLSVREGQASIRDLGSKNGLYVNARPVVACALEPGDLIRFGPVELRLERLDPKDGVLGLDLSSASGDGASAVSRIEKTTLLSPAAGFASQHLELVEAFAERLSAPREPDFPGAMAILTEALAAAGAALVEWRPEPVLLGAAGTVGAVPGTGWLQRQAATAAPTPWLSVESSGADNHWTGVVADHLDDPVGLLVSGDFAGREASVAVLRILLRLSLLVHSPPLVELEESAPASADGLDFPPGILAGESPAMRELYRQMRPLTRGDLPVLILGETGVGKEHLASTLHRSSERRQQPIVAINCAAIPEQLLEAELFGIGKGVATGVQARRGKFAEANGGTLFLDEVGEMSPELQAKLLRALQEKVVHPLGAAPVEVDVRLVAATNADLHRRIEAGEFRSDLYYRLAGFVLDVPPLRDRTQDLPRLIGHFFRRFCAESGVAARGITVKALELLVAYPWPGNVRELEHEVRRLAYLCPSGQAVDSEMLSAAMGRADSAPGPGLSQPGGASDAAASRTVASETVSQDSDGARFGEDLALEPRLEELERQMIREALRRAAGNQSLAARLLGVSRNGLAYRLDRLGLDAADFTPRG